MNAAGRSSAVSAAANSASARSRSSTARGHADELRLQIVFAERPRRIARHMGHGALAPGRRRHRDMRRPGLRIADGEQPLLGPHLDARHEGRERRRDRAGRPAQAIGQVRLERRDRHLILHAGQMREAVARGDAVIDHLQMRRQHGDADPQDRIRPTRPPP